MTFHQDSQLPLKRDDVGPGRPPVEHRFKPGNPGGSAPRGKRITTWMAEFGEIPASKWPAKDSPAFKRLPGNAQIALRRLWCANKDDSLALKNAQYVEPRGLEADGDGASASGVVYTIAAAILALKAAGVEIRKPIDAQIVDPVRPIAAEPASVEEEDEFRAVRLRRGRA